MKYLDKYEKFLEFNSDVEERINFILDKINKVGIDNITKDEKHFLDSMTDDDSANKALDDYNSRFRDESFESDSGNIIFNLTSVESEDSNSDDGVITIYYGDMVISNDILSETYSGEFSINEMGLYTYVFYDREDNNIEDSEILDEKEFDDFLHSLSMDLI